MYGRDKYGAAKYGASSPSIAVLHLGEVAIDVELQVIVYEGSCFSASMQITPGIGISATPTLFWSGSVAIAPAVDLVLDGSYITSASAAITPDANVEAVGNYFTCAVAAIAIAVSQSALCTRVLDGGSVAISVEASVAAAAIRYLFTSIGYSGEFGAGSVLEINSDKMTFILDGVNMIKNIVGSFSNVPPGDTTVTYEDDEVTRDVTLDLKYTPRDS